MSSDKDLIIAANNLSRAAPEQWERFVLALETYTGNKMGEMAAAPVEMLQVTQGRVQALAALSGLLRSCRVTAEKILNKASPNAH